jgi:hypothetical protein
VPQNATYYISDPSILSSRLFNLIDDITAYEGLSDGTNAVGAKLTLSWGVVTMNFMPSEELDEHLHGFEGYIRSIITDPEELLYPLARLHNVKMCIGCNIEHDESDTEAVHTFLFNFNGAVNGLLFLYDSVFDFTGSALVSPADQDENETVQQ